MKSYVYYVLYIYIHSTYALDMCSINIGLATIKPINLWRCASVINGIYDIYIDKPT